MSKVGEQIYNNNEELMTLIMYNNYNDIVVEFEDQTRVKCRYMNFKNGRVRNPMRPSVYGIGFMGQGEFNSVNSRKAYDVWHGMFYRCYDEGLHKRQSTYRDCYVCQEWHNFQVFKAWFDENYIDDYELDKDFLEKGNKEYSPGKCCFLPAEKNIKISSNKGVEQRTLDGELIRVFESRAEAAKATGVCRTGICNCCSGRRKSSGGYKWNDSI